MTKLSFLARLIKERKIQLVDESTEISESYLIKSYNCLKSSKILFKASLYENSLTEAYYAMYNSVLSLFYRCGIKCENHTGAIMILKEIFNLDNLEAMLTNAKKERIDKQYYVADGGFTKEDAMQIIKETEQFILEVRSYMSNLNRSKIPLIRREIEAL